MKATVVKEARTFDRIAYVTLLIEGKPVEGVVFANAFGALRDLLNAPVAAEFEVSGRFRTNSYTNSEEYIVNAAVRVVDPTVSRAKTRLENELKTLLVHGKVPPTEYAPGSDKAKRYMQIVAELEAMGV